MAGYAIALPVLQASRFLTPSVSYFTSTAISGDRSRIWSSHHACLRTTLHLGLLVLVVLDTQPFPLLRNMTSFRIFRLAIVLLPSES